jgi:AraC-like DNA-binding protein
LPATFACTSMPIQSAQRAATTTAVLSGRELAAGSGFAVLDVRCHACRGPWSDVEAANGYLLILVRRGVFRRRVKGTETVVDAGVVYFHEPGEEQQVAHPVNGGDVCTSIRLEESLVASVWGGDPTGLPSLLFSGPALDLAHRLLLGACVTRGAAFEAEERVHRLVAAALRQHDPLRVESGRPSSAALRRKLVGDARELLATEPTRTVRELARRLAVSPHHLSRIFSAVTGASLSVYRNRLRVRRALEQIAAGEESLTRLAAELGFADHAHMTQTIRSETGFTPSALRPLLAGSG